MCYQSNAPPIIAAFTKQIFHYKGDRVFLPVIQISTFEKNKTKILCKYVNCITADSPNRLSKLERIEGGLIPYSKLSKELGEKIHTYIYFLNLETQELTLIPWSKTVFVRDLGDKNNKRFQIGFNVGRHYKSKNGIFFSTGNKVFEARFKVRKWPRKNEAMQIINDPKLLNLYPTYEKEKQGESTIKMSAFKWNGFNLQSSTWNGTLESSGKGSSFDFTLTKIGKTMPIYETNFTKFNIDCESSYTDFVRSAFLGKSFSENYRFIYLNNESPYGCDRLFIEIDSKVQNIPVNCLTKITG